MSDATPPGGGYQPPQPPPAPGYQPPTYQPPPAQPGAPAYQQPAQFQPVNPGASSGNGCLKAFLIVSLISAVLGIIVVVVVVFFVGSAVEDIANDPAIQFGTANSNHYEVTIDECTVDEFGFSEASGTITNKDDVRRAFTVNIEFTEPGSDSNLKLGSGSDITSGLNPGQSEAWEVTGSTGDATDIECKVSDVSYFGN